MAEFNVRLASKGEIRGISDWFLEERSKYPGMSQLVGRGVRGWMVRNVVTPRYLRKAAYTYVLEQDGKTGGFAVVEQGGLAVNLADFAIREGFDRASLVSAMLAQMEQLAHEREYHYLRATPWDSSETALAPFYQAGFHLLDYYLWVFTGQVSGIATPKDVTLVELAAKTALERRLHFLRKELDASQVAGRDLIEAVFFQESRLHTGRIGSRLWMRWAVSPPRSVICRLGQTSAAMGFSRFLFLWNRKPGAPTWKCRRWAALLRKLARINQCECSSARHCTQTGPRKVIVSWG